MYIIAKGNSMLPTLKDGYMYKVEPVVDGRVYLNDIIVFQIGELVICHRVVKLVNTKKGYSFIKTKGDNCLEPDDFAVRTDMIIGKITEESLNII